MVTPVPSAAEPISTTFKTCRFCAACAGIVRRCSGRPAVGIAGRDIASIEIFRSIKDVLGARRHLPQRACEPQKGLPPGFAALFLVKRLNGFFRSLVRKETLLSIESVFALSFRAFEIAEGLFHPISPSSRHNRLPLWRLGARGVEVNSRA